MARTRIAATDHRLTDRYGLSWQIAPTVAEEFIYGPEPEAFQCTVEAILRIVKLDIAAIERAYGGG